MSNDIYSHELRILTCEACGAPLDASVDGGRFECSYCRTVQVLQRRNEDADRAHRSAHPRISESERVAKLRAQVALPEPMPPILAPLMPDGRLSTARVAEARRLWTQTRVQLGKVASFPLAERLFHLSIELIPHLDDRDARAMLETAVELLPDAGHRHVLRCMLALRATFAGDVRAASEWLALCDPLPTDLRMDSAYRVAAAALGAAHEDPRAVVHHMGLLPGDVPMSPRLEAIAFYLRVDAADRLGERDAARRELHDRAVSRGLAAVQDELASYGALRLCSPLLADVARILEERRHAQDLQNADHAVRIAERALEREQRHARTSTLLGMPLLTAVLTSVVALSWTGIVTGVLDKDPLFGAHAHLYCPLVCEGCTGPYEFVHWRIDALDERFSAIYCSRRGHGGAIERGLGVSGNTAQIAIATVPCFVPIGLVLALLAMGILRRKSQRIIQERKHALAAARARYEHLAGRPAA